MFKKLIFFITILIFVPAFANGAILYFKPDSGQYYQDETFSVQLMLDTEKDCINTVKGEIDFSKDVLEAVNFATGNSILTLWLEKPKIEQSLGKISFVGGIPGGYCGPLPGEPGELDLLLKIFFKAKRDGTANLRFSKESQVLLNDGLGTPAKLSLKEAIFEISPEKTEAPKKEWEAEILKDNIPPEPFEIEIHQDPSIFEGKYFIIFSTTDKQTGLDYFEVKEGKRNWQKATSPYLLEDQSLQSIIKVKAVDKAGNERIAEYLPPYRITWKDVLPWIILIIVGIGIIIWLIAKRRKTARKTTRKL
jgi:hypothetical protein